VGQGCANTGSHPPAHGIPISRLFSCCWLGTSMVSAHLQRAHHIVGLCDCVWVLDYVQHSMSLCKP
jgi:hypothetical protein